MYRPIIIIFVYRRSIRTRHTAQYDASSSSFRLFLLRPLKSSSLLLRGAPDTARILCRSFTTKRHRQLRAKDLPTVPTWYLKRESNPPQLHLMDVPKGNKKL